MIRREQFDVASTAEIDVDNRAGSVEVRAGEAMRVIVTIDARDAEDWEVVQIGDSISVRHHGRRSRRPRSARVHVEAPADSNLDVSTASSDVVVVGSFGAARIRTSSGDVRIESIQRLDASTASGDVRVGNVASDLECATVSGDVDVGSVGGRLHASAASGDVRVRSVGGVIAVGTASGDVSVDRCDGADITAKCVSGDVTIGLPAGIRVEPDISTMSGRTMLPSAGSTPSDSTPSDSTPVGDRRSVRVRLSTVSGDITIDRVGE